ncbi:MAG: flagellar hook-basal body complex protein FliE [Gammaproteobacteria bacterium]|nr:flagellar hook-basal body complex protein FliE [Gammaproteobacteria bacterium]MDH5728909.1 flagellar hook-basal body complex protein FliE [Gammaproteobacteria bacterium]
MSIHELTPISQMSSELQSLTLQTVERTQTNFADWMKNTVVQANDKIIQADHNLRALAVGDTDNLHHVMISIEKAKTSFNLVVQIRNKVLEAYNDMMKMQI